MFLKIQCGTMPPLLTQPWPALPSPIAKAQSLAPGSERKLLFGALAIAAGTRRTSTQRSALKKVRLTSDFGRAGCACSLEDLDFRVRAVPGEVTFIDPIDPRRGGQKGPLRDADIQAAFMLAGRWAIGLAKEADWSFNVLLRKEEASTWLCQLQEFSCRPPAHEVPWLLEHFQWSPASQKRDAVLLGGPGKGVIMSSETLGHEDIPLYIRDLRRSQRHTFVILSDSNDELRCIMQNHCDNNLCVWKDSREVRVKVCSVRNPLAGRDDLPSFKLQS
ncbi:unnamed protein product [Symbiodinium sp. CCMP2592]|nr:unnamed protein product [Symbiodinium sp. CCMP2592]